MIFVVLDCSFFYFESKVDFQNVLRKELRIFPIWICFVWLLG